MFSKDLAQIAKCCAYHRSYFLEAILIVKIGFLKARHRRAFKKPILVFPAPKVLEIPKSVSQ
jgi:hypothetical protein